MQCLLRKLLHLWSGVCDDWRRGGGPGHSWLLGQKQRLLLCSTWLLQHQRGGMLRRPDQALRTDNHPPQDAFIVDDKTLLQS